MFSAPRIAIVVRAGGGVVEEQVVGVLAVVRDADQVGHGVDELAEAARPSRSCSSPP